MIFKHISKKSLLLFIGDVFFISLAIFLAPLVRFKGFEFESQQYTWEGGLVILGAYLLVFYLAGLYEIHINTRKIKYLFTFLATIFVGAIFELILFFMLYSLRSSRGVFLLSVILIAVLTYLWRLILEKYFEDIFVEQKRVFIVGAGRDGKAIYDVLKDYSDYNVIGFIDDNPDKQVEADMPPLLGNSHLLDERVKEHMVDLVVISVSHLTNKDLVKCALDCKMEGVRIYDMPGLYEVLTRKIPVEHVDDLWFLNSPIAGVNISMYHQKGKRLFDVIFSCIGLVFTIPLILLAATVIWLERSGEPVFYRQYRVGLAGETFEIIKLRSMKSVAGEDDPVVTRVGRITRKFRIDELPQMWNVLKGDMSLIGPRALVVSEVERFESKVPYFSLRHSVRPGVTGWAQVNYPHGITVEDALEKLRYDFFYIKNFSFILECHILLKTVQVVLFAKGGK
jgi:exopolysaccharide biosynthesis polyprenyl glycosylphosphotransferase